MMHDWRCGHRSVTQGVRTRLSEGAAECKGDDHLQPRIIHAYIICSAYLSRCARRLPYSGLLCHLRLLRSSTGLAHDQQSLPENYPSRND
jgi:hypothetical protein